ncbi:MAG: aminotransferase class I/II-fold pyridoxal phosphate-dependent enzyme [Methylococcaceae bacterium]|nr:aminotransferase class I/II-fold pyridoxal phosphate-dependent enzyme [Methylococcaceae bacterium]
MSFNFCRGGKSRTIYSIRDVGNPVLLTSGRDAIAIALKQIGVNQGSRVLLPAYNCRAMVEVVEWSGAEPVLYRINSDLSMDRGDVGSQLKAGAKAIIVVHYFGFPQELAELRSLCDDTGVQLIEDCAHAYYGVFNGAPPGAVGDYAIASLMKFFPIYDGGCLVSNRHASSDRALVSGGLRFEIKAIFNILERSVHYSRLRPLHWLLPPLFRLKDFIWGRVKQGNEALMSSRAGPAAADCGCGFDPRWLTVHISWISKYIMRKSSVSRCTEGRRANYRFFAERFENIPGCRPIFRILPDGVVPYVFPLFVEDPDRVFPLIKIRRVPVYRWEEVNAGVCENSSLFSRHLFQLPCHEEIRHEELRWISATVIDAVTAKSL